MNPTHAKPPLDICLISNPNSRRNRAQLGAVEAIVAKHPNIHHYITASAAQLPAALSDAAARGITVVAINGGDGTTARVFAELFESLPFQQLPAVVLLPGGTTNMNAGDVGMRGSLTAALRRLADWAQHPDARGERLRRAILRARGASDGQTAYGMFFGAGTIIRGIEYCHENVHSRGIGDEIGPGIALLRTLWGWLRRDPRFSAPTAMRIGLPGAADEPQRQVLLILASSLHRLFLGMRPWWGTETAALHCTWIETPATRLLRLFPSLLRGKPGKAATPRNGYFSHNADSIRLWMDGTFTLDGEMYPASSASGPVILDSAGELEFIRIAK